MNLGEPFTAGQPFKPSAGFFNAVREAVLYLDGIRDRTGAGKGRGPLPAGMIRVKAGTNLSRWDVASITYAQGFTDAEVVENSPPLFTAAAVQFPRDIERWVVLAEPLDAEAVGLAVFGGITPAKIDVPDNEAAKWNYAGLTNAGALEIGPTGARILDHESGTGTGKWALLDLGHHRTTAAYWGYLVEDLDAAGSAAATLSTEAGDIDVTAYAPPILSSGSLAGGAQIAAQYFPHARKWYVTHAAC